MGHHWRRARHRDIDQMNGLLNDRFRGNTNQCRAIQKCRVQGNKGIQLGDGVLSQIISRSDCKTAGGEPLGQDRR